MSLLARKKKLLMRRSAPNIVYVATAQSDDVGNQVCAKPTGTVDGDLMLACIAIPATGRTISPPGGWTQKYHINTNTPTFAIFSKIASSEGSSYTFTVSGAAQAGGVTIITYSGASAVDVVGTRARNASAASIDAPGITPTQPGVLVGFAYHSNGLSVSFTPPSGMTDRGGAHRTFVADLMPSPPGAAGDKTFTWSANNLVAAALLQIR